jgi:alpha-tubulin suppressor-like RCC1 family protein
MISSRAASLRRWIALWLSSVVLAACVSRKCPDGEELVGGKCVEEDADKDASADGNSAGEGGTASRDSGAPSEQTRTKDAAMQDGTALTGDAGSRCPFPVNPCWPDADGDGYAPAGSTPKDVCGMCPSGSTAIEPAGDAVDCKDSDEEVHPLHCWPDADHDGFPADADEAIRVCASKCKKGLTSAEPIGGATDCKDDADTVHPGALESCNGQDDDCDKLTDEDADSMCSVPHATGVCSHGECAIKKCSKGFDDCDEDEENGCEQPLDATDHCGACGNVCAELATCEGEGVGHCECRPPSFGTGTACSGPGPIAAGPAWNCAIQQSGLVDCWGMTTAIDATMPDVAFRQLSMASEFLYKVCGVRTDGSVLCWGNQNTQPAFASSSAKFVQVVVGNDFACGLTEGLSAKCSKLLSREVTAPSSDFIQLAAGYQHACGLHPDGTAECWGLSGSSGCTEDNCGQTVAPPDEFQQIAAGGSTTCGLLRDGLVECWGLGGLNTSLDRDLGQAVPPEDVEMKWITVGQNHACGIRADNGRAICWGAGKAGASGEYDFGQSNPPAEVTFLTLVAGVKHTCGLTTQNEIECWGDNAQGQCDEPDGAFPLNPGVD